MTTDKPVRRHRIELHRANKRRKLEIMSDRPDHWRPATRADCVGGPRPCPYVGCSMNTSLDVTPAGNIIIRHAGPDSEPDAVDPPHSNCALDYAAIGGMTSELVAYAMGVESKQVIDQIEQPAMAKVRDMARAGNADAKSLREAAREEGNREGWY